MKYTVLIVEDDRGICEGIVNTLSPWDIEATPVRDFKNIIGEFAKLNPHLVLMDISLPYMDGYRFCREIRAELRLSLTKMIF